jgi:hypothetical protein
MAGQPSRGMDDAAHRQDATHRRQDGGGMVGQDGRTARHARARMVSRIVVRQVDGRAKRGNTGTRVVWFVREASGARASSGPVIVRLVGSG